MNDASTTDLLANATFSVGGGPQMPVTKENIKRELTRMSRPPMKETTEDKQVKDMAFNVAGEEIRQFIERYETLEAERKDIADQMKEVMAEAKGRGYDTKTLRRIIALRKRDKNDVDEEEAMLELYKAALWMK
jgi:uncharacterized protein (UPF0335 family)